ncbi:hypothetical protein CAEBREN_03449 [Caenorhabditis brenneri]|uniref:Uridine kinase n=1 Tax=Caenorhabditis brenneri TaxID=135651 RepID=G0P6Y2_CAEBE|nr:hypothetical protein CAEBREN_03449 [Caenorhabditis brenneri]
MVAEKRDGPATVPKGDSNRKSVKIEDCPTYSHSSGSSVNEMINQNGGDSSEDSVSPRAAGCRTRRRTMSGGRAEHHLLTTKTGKKIYTKGRPPWYDKKGKSLKHPFVIGVCGGSASGKTTVAEKIVERLGIPWVTILSMDSFYKVLTPEEIKEAHESKYNFDEPKAFDFDLLYEILKRLREGKSVDVPVYDFNTHSRDPNSKMMYGADVLIFEGILAFHDERIKNLMDMKVFVDTDGDLRLARRIVRDVTDRGRDIDGIMEQYFTFVKPAFDKYIAPCMDSADLIVPRGGENDVAIDMIVQNVMAQLVERGYDRNQNNRDRHDLVRDDLPDCLPENLFILNETPQVKGLVTFVRDRDTSRDNHIFYSDRLMRILIEECMNHMPYKDVEIEMAGGRKTIGKRKDALICGLPIMRAGECMETALRSIVKDCVIGKILIQTNETTFDPELHYIRLPPHITRYKVIIMDATVTTGSAAMMAIRVLLDHDVKEEDIFVASLLMGQQGAHALAYAFPKVKLITTAMDHQMTENCYLIPGMGNFGDRYYGTGLDQDLDEPFDV